MSAIEWALLELVLTTEPVGRLSALVVVSTVLLAFALAAVVIASAVRTAVLAGAAPASLLPARRFTAAPPAPSDSGRRSVLSGLPTPRAPGNAPRRSLRAH